MERMLPLLFLGLCMFLTVSLAQPGRKKCRALVLQGGGDKGSYQVGALSEMLSLIPDEIHYDVVSGVSAGALNAAGFSQFPPGQEAQAIAFLLDVWRTITSSNVYQEYRGGLINGLLYEPSLFDTSPLKDYLHEKFAQPIMRKISIGSVNADVGRFLRFNESLSREDFITSVLASAALPALFPYIKINEDVFVDGGVLLGLDVDGAVERCHEIVEKDSDIIVDILLCSGSSLPKVDQDGDKTIQMLGRFIEIHFYSSALDHLLHAFEDNPEVNFRYVIMPTKTLASEPVTLQFDHEEIESMIQQGSEDARNKILNGTFGVEKHQQFFEEEWRKLYGKPRKGINNKSKDLHKFLAKN